MKEQNRKLCSYIKRNGKNCPEVASDDSSLCFWHDPSSDKKIPDLKERLEEKVKIDPNCEGYKLSKANLFDAWLTETIFDDADLSKANLEKGHLFGISLKGASLFKTKCTGANLRHANMDEAHLMGTQFDDAKIGNINWGKDGVILQEILGDIAHKAGNEAVAVKKYHEAEENYLSLKLYSGQSGLSVEEGTFFYREKVMQRKQKKLFSLERLGLKFADLSCGYGEKVGNIIFFSWIVIVFNAFIYSFFGFKEGDKVYQITTSSSPSEIMEILFESYYYSNVTFTTLGYGDFLPTSIVSKLFAGTESFIGAFLVALFVITIYKRLMER